MLSLLIANMIKFRRLFGAIFYKLNGKKTTKRTCRLYIFVCAVHRNFIITLLNVNRISSEKWMTSRDGKRRKQRNWKYSRRIKAKEKGIWWFFFACNLSFSFLISFHYIWIAFFPVHMMYHLFFFTVFEILCALFFCHSSDIHISLEIHSNTYLHRATRIPTVFISR